jgi:hypothetical protein
MIVYGDRCERAEVEARLTDLRESAYRAGNSNESPGVARRRKEEGIDDGADYGSIDHDARCAQVVIDAGSLAQGLLDRAFCERGYDEVDGLSSCVNALLLAAGRFFVARRDHRIEAARRTLLAAIEALAQLRLSGPIELRSAEGHAYYCLYPELYECAAQKFAATQTTSLFVIGVRTIGAGLAGIVAAAAGARHGVATVRPVGHPFGRTIAVGRRLEEYIANLPTDTHFAIVDEGPGASGSSFGGVVDWLVEHGIALRRLHLFPSHSGAPGLQATSQHRAVWAAVDRNVCEWDSWFDRETQRKFFGPGYRQLLPGTWRSDLAIPRHLWPPCFLQQERRKYIAEAKEPGSEQRIARFVGLGRYGTRAERIARVLASRGLGPKVHALRHGFLLTTWCATARPVCFAGRPDRRSLLDTVARYLICRANDLGRATSGSTATELLNMAIFNTSQRFGSEIGSALRRFETLASRLSGEAKPVVSDNRMHAWEWLLCPDGTIYKADATDHHAAHDCIGCQELGWDVAGATVELNLLPEEGSSLASRLAARTEYRPDRARDDFYLLTYLSFQLGYYTVAAAATVHQPEESVRCGRAADRYAAKLYAALAALSS